MANYPHGERHYRARFTDADVLDMRRRKGCRERLKDIAARYGISPSYAKKIIYSEVWTHLPPFQPQPSLKALVMARDARRAQARAERLRQFRSGATGAVSVE